MNGWFILLVAISISVVAAYYSIVGLAAIFAGAAIPVIIMASVLEVGKLVSAVWLHQNWYTTNILMKSYFTLAVVVLMFITSIGIFGFLSRAHIEHSGSSVQLVATIENMEQELARNTSSIDTKTSQIEQLRNQDTSNFNTIQAQIDQEQANIDRIYSRIQPDIDRLESALQFAVARKQTVTESLSILDSTDIRQIQTLVGVPVDGSAGPQTRAAITEAKAKLEAEIVELDQSAADLTNQLVELRMSVEPLVANSNELINQLRSRISFSDITEVDLRVQDLETELQLLQATSRDLTAEKFELETKLRLYEVEIGPIKYIAEFAYGSSDTDLIEKAVRWVIFLIIFVFDPLAVLLVLAGVSAISKNKQARTKEKKLDNLRQELDDISNEFFDGVYGVDLSEPPVADEVVTVEYIETDKPVEKTVTVKNNGRNIRKFKQLLFGKNYK